MRQFFGGFLILALFFINLSCENNNEQPELDKNIPDTLKQYLKFTLEATKFEFIENDSVTFLFSRGYGYSTSDTINYYIQYNIDVMIANKISEGTSYNHNNLDFFFKIPENLTEFKNSSQPIIRTSILESIFQEDSLNFLSIYCVDSYSTAPQVGFSPSKYFLYIDSVETFCSSPDPDIICIEPSINYSSYNPYCNYGHIFKQENSSFFKIERVQSYIHNQLGKSILLSGRFSVNTFYTETATILPKPYKESYTISDGSFMILIPEEDLR